MSILSIKRGGKMKHRYEDMEDMPDYFEEEDFDSATTANEVNSKIAESSPWDLPSDALK